MEVSLLSFPSRPPLLPILSGANEAETGGEKGTQWAAAAFCILGHASGPFPPLACTPGRGRSTQPAAPSGQLITAMC